MKTIIKQIRSALKHHYPLPALALALTLPDTCGAIAYPNPKNHSKIRYIKWFDEWVSPQFADHTGYSEDGKPLRPYFNSNMCYSLRCKFLHESNSDIETTNFYKGDDTDHEFCDYQFELVVNGCNSYGKSWMAPHNSTTREKTTYRVSIDICNLCETICDAVERFIETRDMEDFFNHQISYIDIEETSSRMRLIHRPPSGQRTL